MYLFVLYDIKAQYAERIFQARTIVDAQRSVAQVVAAPETVVAQNPEDFVLYRIGEFHQEKPEIVPANPIESCGNAAHFVRS